jgi:hypothetical protein
VQKKTDSLSYPTYGRGLEPNPNIDSYMINESLCNDNSGGKKKAVAAGGNVSGDGGNGSPMKKPKQKRPKIISPSRMKYETNFESYYISKHLEKKLEEQKAQEVTSSESEGEQLQSKTLITETPFDVITKTTGSINKKVIDRERKSVERAARKMLKKRGNKQRDLTQLEDEVERLLMKEALVMIS